MSAKKILIGLIAMTTTIFSAVFLVSREYALAACSLGIGSIWLFQVTRSIESASSLFFLLFLGLAIWGNLNNVPGPVMLLAFSFDMATWDMARFVDRTRITNEASGKIDAAMESRHLQRLGMTIGAGFLIALLPVVVKVSVNFVGLAFITLLAMFILRQTIIYLRNGGQSGGG